MGLFTRGKVWISADKRTYLEYDAGTQTFSLVVDGVTVLTGTAAGGVDIANVSVNGDSVAHGTPVAYVGDPSGGETVDDEARDAIEDIRDALVAWGIMEAGEGEGEE